jgi:hypothetical protein
MHDINRQIVEHKLYIKLGYKPVREWKRSVRIERQWVVQVKSGKITQDELHSRGNMPILVVEYRSREKSNGDWRMCIDFLDLNKACPMNPFSLPKIDQLIDSTSGFAYPSFMDVFF